MLLPCSGGLFVRVPVSHYVWLVTAPPLWIGRPRLDSTSPWKAASRLAEPTEASDVAYYCRLHGLRQGTIGRPPRPMIGQSARIRSNPLY
jgi:hypothetical protein